MLRERQWYIVELQRYFTERWRYFFNTKRFLADQQRYFAKQERYIAEPKRYFARNLNNRCPEISCDISFEIKSRSNSPRCRDIRDIRRISFALLLHSTVNQTALIFRFASEFSMWYT